MQSRRPPHKRKGPKHNKKKRPVNKQLTARSTYVPGTLKLRSVITPVSIIVPFRLVMDFQLTGSNAVAIRFNPNDVYQPVTGGTTAALLGYAQYMALFGEKTTPTFQWDVEVINSELFPISFFVLVQNNDPGTAPNISKSANPLSQRRNLSAKGGMDRCRLRGRASVQQILGTNRSLVDTEHKSLVNANVADPVWLALCAWTMTLASMTTGLYGQLTLTMPTQFFDRLEQ